MLYLIGLIVILGAIAAFMLTKKHPEAPVVTTSEDKKPATWMSPVENPEAFISSQMSAVESASLAAKASISTESSVAPKAKKTKTKKDE